MTQIWEGAKDLCEFLVPIDDLVGFPGNIDRPEHVPDIAKSLREFGQTRAVLTWENAEAFGFPPETIVAGHHVKAAAEYLEWTHLAATASPFQSEESARRYLALDNLLAQQEVDYQKLQMGFQDVSDYEKVEGIREAIEHAVVPTDVAELKIHERSTRKDPIEAIEHLAANLAQVGFTQPVIVARDGTILAGEDVMRAAALAGISKVPVKRLNIEADSAEALKVMAQHYASGKRAMVDDRAFAEMLKEIKEELETLEGSGYDADDLAGLVMMTRTAAEIKDINAANEWVGLSEYEPVALPFKGVISFETPEERELFWTKNGMNTMKKTLGVWSAWYPPRDRSDPGSLHWRDSGRDNGDPS